MESYEFQAEPGGAATEFMGEGGYPEDRINMSLRLEWDTITANYTMNYIGEHGDGVSEDYDSYVTNDITLEYRTPMNVDLTLGILNFTDEGPVLDGGEFTSASEVLYDLAGRRYFARLKYTF